MKECKTPQEEVSQFNELDLSGTYSYAQYRKWTFDERLELIKGRIFPMSPAPARKHQKISQSINKALLLNINKLYFLAYRTSKLHIFDFGTQ